MMPRREEPTEYTTEHEAMREALENKHGPKEKGPRVYSLTFSLERIRKKLMEVLRKLC